MDNDDIDIEHFTIDHKLTYTFPQRRGANNWRINSVEDEEVSKDVLWFERMKERRFDLRRARLNEFEKYDDRRPQPPTVWVLVINLFNYILRIPLHRSGRPYDKEPWTDEEVLQIAGQCFASKGMDKEAFLSWLKDLEAERWWLR